MRNLLFTFCLFNFEDNFFKKNNHNSLHVGHPFANLNPTDKEIIFKKYNLNSIKKYISILPGSRNSEIASMSKTYIDFIKEHCSINKNFFYLVPAVDKKSLITLQKLFYKEDLPVLIKENAIRDFLSISEFSIATSGTATLESAILGCPPIICYKTNALNYAIISRMLKVDKVGLPNLLLNEDIYIELIQNKFDVDENLRIYFGEDDSVKNRTPIHKEIFRSFEEDPQRFVQKNSGFTVVCNSLTNDNAGEFGLSNVTLKNASLINGAQSQGELKKFFDDGHTDQEHHDADVRVEVIVETNAEARIDIANAGEFYQEAPFILITGGGGIGAKAVAAVDQGEIVSITVTDEGEGYTSPPKVIFTRLVDLKRKAGARQANNSSNIYITGLTKAITPDATEIFVKSTSSFPGSGNFIVGYETISYTAKTDEKFSGLTRGVNFNYDQRIILDTSQDDREGISTYKFNVGDRLIRRVENSSNKISKVYDWNPATRELLVTFEIDELAFIDGGIAATEDATVQFDAGVADSSTSTSTPPNPVLVTDSDTDVITLLTVPISTVTNRKFEDDDENDGAGDGIPDLVNTGTLYENQINLDGGIYNSLYGIEATQGGTNTTLFAVGDAIKDASVPFKFAGVDTAGGLNEGTDHPAVIEIYLEGGSGGNFSVNEVVTGGSSGVQATVVGWDATNKVLQVQNIVPFNTGNVAKGEGGFLYQFSENSTVTDFYIQSAGTNYTGTPTVAIEDVGDIQCTGTVVMTGAGDQVASITINNGGYGITQTVDGTYNLHPTVTFTNASGDTTGAGAVAYAILGGELLDGTGGASYRIKSIDYLTGVRS